MYDAYTRAWMTQCWRWRRGEDDGFGRYADLMLRLGYTLDEVHLEKSRDLVHHTGALDVWGL